MHLAQRVATAVVLIPLVLLLVLRAPLPVLALVAGDNLLWRLAGWVSTHAFVAVGGDMRRTPPGTPLGRA